MEEPVRTEISDLRIDYGQLISVSFKLILRYNFLHSEMIIGQILKHTYRCLRQQGRENQSNYAQNNIRVSAAED